MLAHDRQLQIAPLKHAASHLVNFVKARRTQLLGRGGGLLAHLADDHDRTLTIVPEFVFPCLELGKRYVQGIRNVPLLVIVAIAHIEKNPVLVVDQLDRLLRGHCRPRLA